MVTGQGAIQVGWEGASGEPVGAAGLGSLHKRQRRVTGGKHSSTVLQLLWHAMQTAQGVQRIASMANSQAGCRHMVSIVHKQGSSAV